MSSTETPTASPNGTETFTATISCEIIGEIGASHCQDLELAKALIHTLAHCGANAVKFSMFIASDMTLISDDDRFQIKSGPWQGSLYSLYKKCSMPYDWIPELKALAEEVGLKFIAGVYHPRTVEIAKKMGVEYFKVASFEIGYLDLIDELIYEKVYVSTGSAEPKYIGIVVQSIPDVTLLKCTSQYPANLEDMSLATIPDMLKRYGVPVGLSDHSCGYVAPSTAVALGATVIEKHIMLNGGLDDGFAMEPAKFYQMVQVVRAVEQSIGVVKYGGPKTFHREFVGGRMVRVVHDGS